MMSLAQLRSTVLTLGSLVIALGWVSPVAAQVSNVAQVGYGPTIREIQGPLPVFDSYPLAITSPSSMPVGSTVYGVSMP